MAGVKGSDDNSKISKQQMAGNLSEEIEEGLGSLPVMRIAEVFYLLSHQQSPQSTLDKGDATYRNELMQFIKSNSWVFTIIPLIILIYNTIG